MGRQRAGAMLGAMAVQLVFGALIIWGLAVHSPPRGEAGALQAVSAFELPPPPSPEQTPQSDTRDAAREAPAPEAAEAEALPIEAPDALLAVTPSPAAPRAGEGRDARSGAGTQGPGSGAGGAGAGKGGGGVGGIATPAQRIAGELRDSDYPRAAAKENMAGVVGISFRVRTDGRVDRCTVVRSSGHTLLDELTCRLFTQRYRFRPAMTAGGIPVESTLRTSFTWGTRRR